MSYHQKMNEPKPLFEIKYNRFQTLLLLLIPLALIEPVRRMIIQGWQFREYYWFIFSFIIFAFIFWNFIRLSVFTLAGIPAIVLTTKGIKLTQLGYDIEWNDISEINLIESGGKTTTYELVISVKDDWKYIGGLRNPLLRYYRWYTREGYNSTPFSVRLNLLEGDSLDIYNSVENCYHSHKKSAIYE